jgi:hypothetical protein
MPVKISRFDHNPATAGADPVVSELTLFAQRVDRPLGCAVSVGGFLDGHKGIRGFFGLRRQARQKPGQNGPSVPRLADSHVAVTLVELKQTGIGRPIGGFPNDLGAALEDGQVRVWMLS